ncbi:hypothetical protein BE221DRAFT_69873 [Ostreococcus tauri]|uniref:Uncharacterized protein n=1 Tax=Ostreococcus tauri TaxID=70448 RepID=A0A1Y5IEQ7_OSTTA|nr:hypothetical protein BE221DRAFT_69873 [Ostreococcus tauri]
MAGRPEQLTRKYAAPLGTATPCGGANASPKSLRSASLHLPSSRSANRLRRLDTHSARAKSVPHR